MLTGKAYRDEANGIIYMYIYRKLLKVEVGWVNPTPPKFCLATSLPVAGKGGGGGGGGGGATPTLTSLSYIAAYLPLLLCFSNKLAFL